jgi:hypothetical protein
MLVDRILIHRLDSLEGRGKTDIDTLILHCNIIRGRRARACRELCKEHPCTYIELIEEALIQIHGLCYSLCIDVNMLMSVCFLSYICFSMLCM